MDTLTQPEATPSGASADGRNAHEWLDALAGGVCDEATFFREIEILVRRSPDTGWDLLGRLDQYYRRRKLKPDLFESAKRRLQSLLLGDGDRTEGHGADALSSGISAPMPIDAPTTPIAAEPAAAPADVASAAVTPPPAVAPSSDRTFVAGDVLRGRYRIQRIIGQGGTGTVYEAIDSYRVADAVSRSGGDREHSVALKVLHTAVMQRPRLFNELRREFRHLQSLSHPHIVRVHELDRDGDVAFYTMEQLHGALLDRVLAVHQPAAMLRPHALSILRAVGSAVAYAHSRGVAHGDLSPRNIFITQEGEVRVLDFARVTDSETAQAVPMATPNFASCEVLQGDIPDARDDVFAFACLVYLLLTGAHPFDGLSALQARSARRRLKRPHDLSRKQWHALRSGLQFERAKRPSDMQSWVAVLLDSAPAERTLAPLATLLAPLPSRRGGALGWMATATLVVASMVFAWWAARNEDWIERQEALLATHLDELLPVANHAPRENHVRGPGVASAASQPLVTAASPPLAIAPSPASAPTPAKIVPPPAVASTPVRASIEFAADTVDIAATDPMARVVVRRSRSLRGPVTFSWWTESGTAKAGKDFASIKPHIETIADGKNTVDLFVPIVFDPSRHEPRSFYVVIDAPSDNALLGQRTLAMVTLPETQ